MAEFTAPLFVFQFFIIFARLGTALIIFPALSDPAISPRIRLLFALAASLALFPALEPGLPGLPATTSGTLNLIGGELIYGLLMGISARLMFMAMSLAGELIAFMAGFQSATLFDPASGSSTTAPTLFLTLVAGMLIFALNLHHQLIDALVLSFTAFPPGGPLPASESILQAVLKVFEIAFTLGVQIAAPVVAAGLLANLMFGVFNRLIPQLQIFFITIPLSLTLGMLILGASMGAITGMFGTALQNNLLLFQQETDVQ